MKELLNKTPALIQKKGKLYRLTISKVNTGEWYVRYQAEAPNLEMMLMVEYSGSVLQNNVYTDLEDALNNLLKEMKEQDFKVVY